MSTDNSNDQSSATMATNQSNNQNPATMSTNQSKNQSPSTMATNQSEDQSSTPMATDQSAAVLQNDENRTPNLVFENGIPRSIACYTPHGSQLWFREIESEFTPAIGKQFPSIEEAEEFYKIYALAVGFETRIYSSKRDRNDVILSKTLVCNCQGFRENRDKNVVVELVNNETENKTVNAKRRTKITRFGCKAMIHFRLQGASYVVTRFEDKHNHRLCRLKYREFQKQMRRLTLYHKQTILDHSRLNIGATKSFRICKEYAKGYGNVGATLGDFKNFDRDMKCFIGDRDAQMITDKFKRKAEINKGFYYAYEMDDDDCLCRIFWTDAKARKNYAVFGDAVSYDPTYGTNKYYMTFTPFTGVDHNKKSVTFACALLSHEDEESFRWAFEKFLDAMGHREPQCFFTDQDPALKAAVPSVFKHAKHRFCMWHITDKVKDKVGTKFCNETQFLTRFNSIIWDINLEPSGFEEKWSSMIVEFELESHGWLMTLFNMRDMWIPIYFKDMPMGCILRTTQRSESENSFFKKFQSEYGTLVEFWMRYETAIEQQRYGQKTLDKDNHRSLPQTLPPLPIEVQASRVYTHNVFYDFQVELMASIGACGVAGFTKTDDLETTVVMDAEKRKTFEVVYHPNTNEAVCSCKFFNMKGLLCRHVLWILSGKGQKCIPDRYILNRWTKDALKKPIPELDASILEDAEENDGRKHEFSLLWSEIYATVSCLANKEMTDIKALGEVLKLFRQKIEPNPQSMTKEQELEMLLGCKSSVEVTIHPPKISSNKGSGSGGKRLISNKKQAIEDHSRPPRLCANCHKMAHHDKRTCPYRTTPEAQDTPEMQPVPQKPPRFCKNCKQYASHDKRNCPVRVVEKAQPIVTQVPRQTTPQSPGQAESLEVQGKQNHSMSEDEMQEPEVVPFSRRVTRSRAKLV